MSTIIVTSYEKVAYTIDFLLTCKTVYFDIETTGLDPYTDDLLIVSIHGRDHHGDAYTFVYDVVQLGVEILNELRVVLESPYILKVAHNAVFDCKHLLHHGDVLVSPVYCTMIAEQVIKSGLLFTGFGLDDVAERRLSVVMDKSIRQGFINRPRGLPFTDDELEYAARDVWVLESIYEQQQQEIAAEKLGPTVDVESELIPITAELEYNGVNINRERLEAARPVVQKIIDAATQRLQDILIDEGAATEITFSRDGYSAVNTGSPKQMLAAFNAVGIDVRSLGKKELSDWDAQWAKRNRKSVSAGGGAEDDDFDIGYAHPILKQHAIRTAAAKLEGTYITGLIGRINPVTRRVHPGYKQCGAVATGRMSSVAPNMQNLPNQRKLAALGLEDHDIRSMFIPAPGCDFIICDYSSIELAILAAMSSDERLIYEILRGDVHTYVTDSLVGDRIEKALGEPLSKKNAKIGKHKAIRDLFKQVSFGIVYGSTGYNLYRTLYFDLLTNGIEITREMADNWVERWKHELFPQTGRLLEQNSNYAVTRYYTESALGRRRHWEKDIRFDKWRMLAAMREGSNQPIQATCADMLKLSMIALNAVTDKRRGRIVAPVHDELLCESVHEYTEEYAGLIKVSMESNARALFPNADPMLFKAEPKISDRYDK